MTNTVENLKLAAGTSKAPVGIVPMHPLYGMARVLEDSACKYAPFNYMAQPLKDALMSYDSAFLRHRIACTLLGGEATLASYAAIDDDSGLPHIFHMITGLAILATLMIRDGVIKLDPGQGKRKKAAVAKAAEDLESALAKPLGNDLSKNYDPDVDSKLAPGPVWDGKPNVGGMKW